MREDKVLEQLVHGNGHDYLQGDHNHPGNPAIDRALSYFGAFGGTPGSQFFLKKLYLIHELPSSPVPNYPAVWSLPVYLMCHFSNLM